MAKKGQVDKRTQRATVVRIGVLRDVNDDGEVKKVVNLDIVWEEKGERTWGQVAAYGEAAARVYGLVMNLETLRFEHGAKPIQPDDIIEVSGNFSEKPWKKPRKKEFKLRKTPTWTLYFQSQIKNFGRPKADWSKLIGKGPADLA
jgi:hypothetical protein